jgi:hypothetical protein
VNEIWKDIEGYEGTHQVSTLGRVRSLDRTNTVGAKIKGKIMKQQSNKDGYMQVTIKSGVKKTFLVHRLVAKAFIPNPQNYLEVNHKDVNVKNNRIDNLEWCDRTYNCNYAGAHEKVAKSLKIPVIQMDMNGNFIQEWDSIKEAAQALNIPSTNITCCCKHPEKRKSIHGYKWKYK